MYLSVCAYINHLSCIAGVPLRPPSVVWVLLGPGSAETGTAKPNKNIRLSCNLAFSSDCPNKLEVENLRVEGTG